MAHSRNSRRLRKAVRAAASAACLLATAAASEARAMPLAERLQQCAACHGEDGNSKLAKIPSLAGQPAFYVLNQLFLMREGVRRVEPMAEIVKELTDEDLEALSKHYSKLEAKRSEEAVDPALAQHGAEMAARMRCTSCHGPALAGDEQVPRIARQRIDYTVEAMKSMRDNKRPGSDSNMAAAIGASPDADLTALAHFAASK